MRTFLVAASLASLLACASGQSAGESAAAATPATPCGVTVAGESLTGWRQVVTPEFSLCFPTDWNGAGRSWRGTNARIQWSTSSAGAPSGSGVYTARAAGSGPTSMSPRTAQGPPAEHREMNETIDGRQVRLWQTRYGGTDYQVGAEWIASGIRITGEARTPAAAENLLVIYRTVRLR